MDYQSILDRIYHEVQEYIPKGRVADYIPALAKVNQNQFGFAIRLNNGQVAAVGDVEKTFSIQSISKLLTLSICLSKKLDFLGSRVGIEPSGTAFNSLIQLETEAGIPRNPFINAGALVVTDVLYSSCRNSEQSILDFARKYSMNSTIRFNEEIALSEKETGFRNIALINFMKSFNNIDNNPEDVLNVYFKHCSLEMNCLDLINLFSYLSNYGMHGLGEVLDYRNTKRVNALMLSCGTYDAVGSFAFKVGLPAKSGVGGGIVAVIPGKMTLAVWSPGLDNAGNSLAGAKALELFTTYTGISVF